MLLDILNSNNYISFNITVAKVFGLNAAVYCSELLNIYKKCELKNKFVDDKYIKIDRKYVFERTCLSIEDQLKVDANLMKLNIIIKHKDDPDIVIFDYQLLYSIACSDDLKLLANVSKRVKINSPKGTRESMRQRMINDVKNSIVCSNYELLTALRGWVDSIFANPNGYLSKSVVSIFQTTLNNYTKGVLDLALRIVQIATTQGYKNCEWAINLYEKDLKIKGDQQARFTNNLPRVTTQKKISSKEDVGEEVF